VASLPAAVVNSPYATTVPVTGGTAPYTWSVVAGTLPTGLTLAPTTGRLTGTVTTTGPRSVTFRVTDADGRTTDRVLAVGAPNPVSITSLTLANATVGTAYSATLTATGGTPPYTWSVASGTLPAGLTLTSGGTLSGTPTTAATTTFSVKATDQLGAGATAPLSLVVAAPTLRVSGLTITKSTVSTRSNAVAKVTVVDGNGTPVPSVQVSGRWTLSTGATANRTITTAANGTASSTSPNYTNARGRTVTFCVTAISRTGYVSRLTTSCTSTTF
jgi:hypothetical protein